MLIVKEFKFVNKDSEIFFYLMMKSVLFSNENFYSEMEFKEINEIGIYEFVGVNDNILIKEIVFVKYSLKYRMVLLIESIYFS